MLPSARVTTWTTDVAAVLWLPLTPPAHGLMALRHWLRPQRDDAKYLDAQLLSDERDLFRALWHSERIHTNELEQKLQQLDRAKKMDRGGREVAPLLVSVTARGEGPGERMLALNAGSRDGVQSGDPAVIGGDILVGRLVGEPTGVRCWLAPLTDPSTGRVDAFIAPADRPEAGPNESVVVQLRPDSAGILVGDIDASKKVFEGDIVRLADATWKPAAQGMRMGTVVAVRRSDKNPLRLRVEVKTNVDPDQLRQVTLKIDAEAIP
jgi:cell shape-determining protein MreC